MPFCLSEPFVLVQEVKRGQRPVPWPALCPHFTSVHRARAAVRGAAGLVPERTCWLWVAESCSGGLLTLLCHTQIGRPGVAHTPFVTPVVLGSAGTEQPGLACSVGTPSCREVQRASAGLPAPLMSQVLEQVGCGPKCRDNFKIIGISLSPPNDQVCLALCILLLR